MTDKQRTNNETEPAYKMSVPYFIHEGALAREERTARRFAILCGISFAALIISNAAWLAYYL